MIKEQQLTFDDFMKELCLLLERVWSPEDPYIIGCIIQSDDDEWFEWNGETMEKRSRESLGQAIMDGPIKVWS